MAINADQTDAGSAVDQTLMDELRRRSAEFDIGDYKEHNSYNGILPVGAGWMLCDGRIINEASYNSEHGAGKWALDIGTTVLEGLYLPDFDNKFSVGGDTTTQTGASPITSEGNADHEINLRHNHQWMKGDINFSGNRDRNRTWDSAGNEINLVKYTTDETQAGSPLLLITDPTTGVNVYSIAWDYYTDNQHSTTQSIKPEAIKVQKYMRII